MESFFSRYRNEWVLVTILFVQLIALATQVRVPNNPKVGLAGEAPPDTNGGGTRLLRVWAEGLVAPFQKLAVNTSHGVRYLWFDYIDLRGVRRQNEDLRRQLTDLRFKQAQIQEDAEQGRRLQALLDFKQQFILKTVAAQVIGTSGTELSRVIYIDRGTKYGIQPGMAVITPDGIVGKISRADSTTSQVLLITDPQSGAGVVLERLRVNGILKGTNGRLPEMQNVMSDEPLQAGDRILTTGGDRVFPRGLPVGSIDSFYPDHDREPFMVVKVKPAVNLGRLAEVLVVTELATTSASAQAEQGADVRAADILAERLPSIKKKTKEQIAAEEKAAPTQIVSDTVPAGVDTAAVPTDAEGRPLTEKKTSPPQPAHMAAPTGNPANRTTAASPPSGQPKANAGNIQPKPATAAPGTVASPAMTQPSTQSTVPSNPPPQGQPR